MSGLLNILSRFISRRPEVGQTPCDVVHRENKWRLLRYRARPEGLSCAAPILLVPSLINRHYVLDLMPGKSLIETLVDWGHDIYIIDWGTPAAEDRYLDFDDICDRYLGRAVRVAARTSKAEAVHLLGYCLGGTLATIYTAVRPKHVASLITLAGPIGFHDSGMLSLWMRNPTLDINAVTSAFGNMPWPMMQASFHMQRPTGNLSKGVRLIDRAWDDEFLDGFFAVETWGNDNVSFPGRAYAHYIQTLYRDDALLSGTLRMSGLNVDLSSIRCPTFVVTFEHDDIVPHESASVLLDRVGAEETKHLHLPGGHVGAVVSKKARKSLWPVLSQWWSAHPIGRSAAVGRVGRDLG